MAIKWVGLDALEKDIKKATNITPIKTVVKKNGADLQNAMQRKADFRKGYQTGTTKRSIGLEITDGGMTAKVGPTTEYSPYLEYGTRLMSPQPFVRPAFWEIEPKFKADIAKVIIGGDK